jgi:rubrerythrin
MERVTIADANADSVAIASFERDRRDLLRRGFALGGAAIAAGWIPLLLSVRNAFADSDGDLPILERAITLERTVVLAYDELISGGALRGGLLRVARRFRAHEQEHADALTTALTDLGGTPPQPPKGAAAVDEVVEGLREVRSRGDALSFAIELETAAVAAYHDALARLVEGKLLQTGTSIMANEGQHLVVLRRAAGSDPVPNALERGEA